MWNDEQIRKDIFEWVERLTLPRAELGNFPICPFAKAATVQINVTNSHDFLHSITKWGEGADVTIFVVEDEITFAEMTDLKAKLSEKNPDIIFLINLY